MLQREVVERLVARPGGGDYGRLTVMLAPWVHIERLFDIGPGAFQPAPRVWSAMVRLTVRPHRHLPSVRISRGRRGRLRPSQKDVAQCAERGRELNPDRCLPA
jgi:16S rRNA A1518/A1519 N6-dimethyltransferase RsmA/KsgA/DIM1 with predicted DNA glycosylase/AP lyase activity